MSRGPGFKPRFNRDAKQGLSRYKDSDSSMIKRVIKDGYDGEEVIVSGNRETTFGQACKDQWQFVSVKRNSRWYIKDDRGNDVSDKLLQSVDGIFVLVPEYGSESQKELPDKSDEYSSIHDSVTYYD
ncbi:MAG: hypothetical protein RTU63_15140 [Candidatus Thorarchaeota archaeon]